MRITIAAAIALAFLGLAGCHNDDVDAPPFITVTLPGGASVVTATAVSGFDPPVQSVTIGNLGSRTLNYTATVTAGGTWLSVAPATGPVLSGAQATMDIVVDVIGPALAPGLFTGAISIDDPGASNGPVVIDVDLIVDPAPILTLSATNLTFGPTAEFTTTAETQTSTVTNTASNTPPDSVLRWTASGNQPWILVSPASALTLEGTDSTVLNISVIVSHVEDWLPGGVSISGAPSARYGHTAVWTGTRMVVWGGWDGAVSLQDGAVYDPVTDVWVSSVSLTNVPSARLRHSAVYTGTDMVVWGGWTGFANLNDGAQYDPATNTWTLATSLTDAPTVRSSHSAVWDWANARMIVWGGTADVNNPIANGRRYDPAADTWDAADLPLDGEPPVAKLGHAAVFTGLEMIVWGGFDGLAHTNGGSLFDPFTDTWAAMSTTDAPTARSSHTAVWTGLHMIAWGGFGGGSTFFDWGKYYDPATDTWSFNPTTAADPDTPSARSDHSAIWTGTEMVIWAGQQGFDALLNEIILQDGGVHMRSSDLTTNSFDLPQGTFTGTVTVNDPVANQTQVINISVTVTP